MPYDLTEPLVIGISSRALFNLEEENRIYENEGLAAYEEYQVKHRLPNDGNFASQQVAYYDSACKSISAAQQITGKTIS